MSAKEEGLKQKYIVSRVDRNIVGPTFVLEYEKDPYAVLALKSYAEACRDEYPVLAEDLLKIVAQQGE